MSIANISAIISLALEMGWKITKEDPAQCLQRLELDEHRLDIWNSRKGITVGVYHDKSARYHRNTTKLYLKELVLDPEVLKKEKRGKLIKSGRIIKEK